MVRPKCPCTRDCAERTAVCHGTCERYLKYEQQMRLFYAEKREIARGLRSNARILKNIDRQAKQGRRGSSPLWRGE